MFEKMTQKELAARGYNGAYKIFSILSSKAAKKKNKER